MKILRYATVLTGLVMLLFSAGFIFRMPFATGIWPWEDGRYSHLFIGSILAAVSAAALWIGWTGKFGALPGGSLNVFIIALTTCVYFFLLVRGGRTELVPYAVGSALSAVVSGAAFLWSRRLPEADARPIPAPVRISFWIFAVTLLLAGGVLILRLPVFPWTLNPDSSVIFGCIFLGDAFYFLYGLLRPRWHNAFGQLLSFLAYDLVLIVPFVALVKTVKPELLLNLVVYIAVLLYSGALAVYYLFINSRTRFGSN